MSTRRTLNIAMIGHGFMGRAHSNAFHQASHFFEIPFDLKLKVICGRDRTALERMAARWGWEKTATDWEQVVRCADIDVVDICTPNFLHEPIAIAAARAGKIVLCEKPLANSVEEAERMTAAARGVPTLVWFNYRRAPAVALAERLIREGRLGEIYHYRGLYLQSWGASPPDPMAWRFNAREAGSGAAGDLLSHSIDLATWLNGPLTRLCSQVRTFIQGREVDDAVTVMAEFRNGSLGTFEATRFASGNQNRNSFEINGSRGSLEFDLERMNELQFTELGGDPAVEGRRRILATGPGHPYVDRFWPPGHIIGYEHTFIATLVDFLAALRKEERFHPDFSDALDTQRLLAAVHASSESQRWTDVVNETAVAGT
jgi:predicted dehydrogenase